MDPDRFEPVRIFITSHGGLIPEDVYLQVDGWLLTVRDLTGHATGTSVPSTRPRTKQDLVLGALLVVIVCFTWINLATEPFPKSLIEPLAVAIGPLGWAYERQ